MAKQGEAAASLVIHRSTAFALESTFEKWILGYGSPRRPYRLASEREFHQLASERGSACGLDLSVLSKVDSRLLEIYALFFFKVA